MKTYLLFDLEWCCRICDDKCNCSFPTELFYETDVDLIDDSAEEDDDKYKEYDAMTEFFSDEDKNLDSCDYREIDKKFMVLA